MNKAMDVTKARENLSVVMDQLTKELREVTSVTGGPETNDGSRANFGVTLPTASTTVDTTRGIADVLTASSKVPGTLLLSGDRYFFNPTANGPANSIVLEFFTIDTSGTPAKHRIRYSVTAPMVGSTYAGLAQRFWCVATGDTNPRYEPCEITYCNNTWNGSSWSGDLPQPMTPQPMTDQVVTGFTVTRPSWSPNVLQITLEAQVRGLGGTGYSTVRLIGLVTVRQ
jgi:hypothetical protein